MSNMNSSMDNGFGERPHSREAVRMALLEGASERPGEVVTYNTGGMTFRFDFRNPSRAIPTYVSLRAAVSRGDVTPEQEVYIVGDLIDSGFPKKYFAAGERILDSVSDLDAA
jgi:hypothetical protein